MDILIAKASICQIINVSQAGGCDSVLTASSSSLADRGSIGEAGYNAFQKYIADLLLLEVCGGQLAGQPAKPGYLPSTGGPVASPVPCHSSFSDSFANGDLRHQSDDNQDLEDVLTPFTCSVSDEPQLITTADGLVEMSLDYAQPCSSRTIHHDLSTSPMYSSSTFAECKINLINKFAALVISSVRMQYFNNDSTYNASSILSLIERYREITADRASEPIATRIPQEQIEELITKINSAKTVISAETVPDKSAAQTAATRQEVAAHKAEIQRASDELHATLATLLELVEASNGDRGSIFSPYCYLSTDFITKVRSAAALTRPEHDASLESANTEECDAVTPVSKYLKRHLMKTLKQYLHVRFPDFSARQLKLVTTTEYSDADHQQSLEMIIEKAVQTAIAEVLSASPQCGAPQYKEPIISLLMAHKIAHSVATAIESSWGHEQASNIMASSSEILALQNTATSILRLIANDATKAKHFGGASGGASSSKDELFARYAVLTDVIQSGRLYSSIGGSCRDSVMDTEYYTQVNYGEVLRSEACLKKIYGAYKVTCPSDIGSPGYALLKDAACTEINTTIKSSLNRCITNQFRQTMRRLYGLSESQALCALGAKIATVSGEIRSPQDTITRAVLEALRNQYCASVAVATIELASKETNDYLLGKDRMPEAGNPHAGMGYKIVMFFAHIAHKIFSFAEQSTLCDSIEQRAVEMSAMLALKAMFTRVQAMPLAELDAAMSGMAQELGRESKSGRNSPKDTADSAAPQTPRPHSTMQACASARAGTGCDLPAHAIPL